MAKQNVVVKPCGLFISRSYNLLAASPDGLVNDVDSPNPNSNGLVEVNLVFLEEYETLCQTLVRKRIFLPDPMDGHIVINSNHGYHYQVQQQMFVTEKQWLEFVAKGVQELSDRSIEETDGLCISLVKFNPELWSSVLPKREAFYNEQILVELAYPVVKYGFPNFCMRGL